MSEGLEQKKKNLKEEIEKLKHEYKVELPKKIAEARAYGDLKENAEYHAARERHSFVQARISQLNEQLSKLTEMNVSDIPEDKTGYGSTLTILDLDSDDRLEFTLVSPDEVDPSGGKISQSSPIGSALSNRSAGEEVEVTIPAGKKRYLVEKFVTVHGRELSV